MYPTFPDSWNDGKGIPPGIVGQAIPFLKTDLGYAKLDGKLNIVAGLLVADVFKQAGKLNAPFYEDSLIEYRSRVSSAISALAHVNAGRQLVEYCLDKLRILICPRLGTYVADTATKSWDKVLVGTTFGKTGAVPVIDIVPSLVKKFNVRSPGPDPKETFPDFPTVQPLNILALSAFETNDWAFWTFRTDQKKASASEIGDLIMKSDSDRLAFDASHSEYLSGFLAANWPLPPAQQLCGNQLGQFAKSDVLEFRREVASSICQPVRDNVIKFLSSRYSPIPLGLVIAHELIHLVQTSSPLVMLGLEKIAARYIQEEYAAVGITLASNESLPPLGGFVGPFGNRSVRELLRHQYVSYTFRSLLSIITKHTGATFESVFARAKAEFPGGNFTLWLARAYGIENNTETRYALVAGTASDFVELCCIEGLPLADVSSLPPVFKISENLIRFQAGLPERWTHWAPTRGLLDRYFSKVPGTAGAPGIASWW